MEDFTLEERRKTIGFYWKPDKYFGKCAFVKHFVSLGIQEKFSTELWPSLSVEKRKKVTKEARKWKKSCQAPCFCQEEASSTIM